MPINVFGYNFSSHDDDKKSDTCLFAQKPFSRTSCIENNFDENMHKKNLFRITNLRNPIFIREASLRYYVGKKI